MGTVYLYYGDDDFSIRDAVTAIIGGVDGDDMPELNTSTLEGSSVSFEELMAACHTLPFMSPRRLVVVKGLLTRFGPSISSRQ
ncbi:MAG: polymerase delta subunit, partial [Dehalococcoidia bacterium]|nr:polymerase delta subunit [Dehalococcoidia bacterium]